MCRLLFDESFGAPSSCIDMGKLSYDAPCHKIKLPPWQSAIFAEMADCHSWQGRKAYIYEYRFLKLFIAKNCTQRSNLNSMSIIKPGVCIIKLLTAVNNSVA